MLLSRSAVTLLHQLPRNTTAVVSPCTRTRVLVRNNHSYIPYSNMTALQKEFFTADAYAVVGASNDKSKFGNKVFMWYLDHSKTVTPIHPKEASIEGVPALKSLSELPSPATTSISVITPPKVTLGVLKEAKELGIKVVWVQPGASDEACDAYVKEAGLENVIYGGPCILRDGEAVLASIGK